MEKLRAACGARHGGLVRYDPFSRGGVVLAGEQAPQLSWAAVAALEPSVMTTGSGEAAGCCAVVPVSETVVLSLEMGPAPDVAAAGMLRALLPHLVRSLRAGWGTGRTLPLWCGAAAVLDRLPFGVMFLDAAGLPLIVNACARRALDGADGLVLGRVGLQADDPRDSAALRGLIGQCCSGGAGGLLRLSRPSGLQPLSIMVAPLEAQPDPLGAPVPAALLFVGDPDQPAGIDDAVLRRLYDLTPAEARLASRLIRGESLEQAAREMQVAVTTVRTHLKRMFGKMGVQRQAELVRLLLKDIVLMA